MSAVVSLTFVMVVIMVIIFPVNSESGNVVGVLISNRDVPPGGIDVEYSWIIPEHGSVAYASKRAIVADLENADGVARAVCPVDEVAVGGNADFRTEIRTGESRRQTRDDLLLRKTSRGRIENPEHDGGRFLLNGVEPGPVGVKREVPGPIARGHVYEGCRSRSQRRNGSRGQFPDVNPVLPQIGLQNPLFEGSVCVWWGCPPSLMTADRETPRRRVGGRQRPNVSGI